MTKRSPRFRDFVLALDLGAAAAVLTVVLAVLAFIFWFFSSQYIASRRNDVEKTRLLLEEHLQQAREDLQYFITLSEGEREQVDARFLRSFTDLYRLNDQLQIEKIYVTEQNSRLFQGYSFAEGRLGQYLRRMPEVDAFSDIIVGLEDEEPSFYYAMKTPSERFLARVEIWYVTSLLDKMTVFSGMPILLLSQDGFVVTSSVPDFGISTLNIQLSDKMSRPFRAKGQRWIPLFSQSPTAGVTVALLVPLNVINLLRNILLTSALLCTVALVTIMLFKRQLTSRLMLKPLSAFADRLRSLPLDQPAPAMAGFSAGYRFEELSLLDQRLTEMAQTIFEREEGLRTALAQLNESRSFTIQAVDHSRQFFGWLTPDGIVQYANRAALAAIDKEPHDVVGRPLWETRWFRSEEHEVKRLREAIKRAAAGEIVEYEIKQSALTGFMLMVDFSIHPIFDADGKVTMLVAEGWDVSERIRAEQERAKLQDQLYIAQKMESVGRLAGGVAHDFNNMLGVILGYTEVALAAMDSSQPYYHHLEEIAKAAERSAALTRQLLAFARRQTIVPKTLDLNETITGMLQMLQRLLGENITLAWRPASTLWTIRMDPSQIDQILANLCVNARDAIDGVGTIIIETENCILDTVDAADSAGAKLGQYVKMTVSDNGRGMDPQTLEHVFEPFYTTKAIGKGTGLGLATIYGIVKQNDGVINVYSEASLGTTFTIYLPRYVRAEEAAQESSPVQPVVRGDETLLLVEDEHPLMEMFTMMLQQMGYTVLLADTPREAMHIAQTHQGPIHLLLTDVIMPEMNGRELANRLMETHPQMRLLFMSGYTADVIAHHGVLDEGLHFIQKPFSMQKLSATLRQVLDQP